MKARVPSFESAVLSWVLSLLLITSPIHTAAPLYDKLGADISMLNYNMYECIAKPESDIFFTGGGGFLGKLSKITLTKTPVPNIDSQVEIRPFTDEIVALEYLDDTNILAAGFAGLRVIKISDGAVVHEMLTDKRISALAKFPTTNHACVITDIAPVEAYVYDYITKTEITKNTGSTFQEKIVRMVLRPDSDFLVFGGNGSFLSSLDRTNLNYVSEVLRSKETELAYTRILATINGRFRDSVIFSTDNGYLLEGDFPNKIALFDHQVGIRFIHKMELIGGSDLVVISIAFLRTVSVFDLAEKKELGKAFMPFRPFTFCFNQKHRVIAALGEHNTFMAWDTNKPSPLTCDDTNCTTCHYKNNFCVKCVAGKILDNGKCVDMCTRSRFVKPWWDECMVHFCPNGTYYDKTNKTCPKCIKNCLVCSNATDCIKCDTNHEFKDGACAYVAPPEPEPEPTPTPTPQPEEEEKEEPLEPSEYQNLFTATSSATKVLVVVTALSSPNNRRAAAYLFQLFLLYSVLERVYDKNSRALISIFSQNGAGVGNFEIFADKSKDPKERKDMTDNVSDYFFNGTEGTIYTFLVFFLIGILFYLIYNTFSPKGSFKKSSDPTIPSRARIQSLEIPNNKKDNFCMKFMKIYNKRWLFQVFFDIQVRLVLSAWKNILFGYEFFFGLTVSLMVIFMYCMAILTTVVMLSKGKMKWLVSEVNQGYIDNFLLKYLVPMEYVRDMAKCLLALIFRGDLENQITAFAICHMVTLGLKVSSGTPMYEAQKWESLYKFLKEIFEVVSYVFILSDNNLMNNLFFITLIFQVLLVVIKAIVDAIVTIRTACGTGSSNNPDSDVRNLLKRIG